MPACICGSEHVTTELGTYQYDRDGVQATLEGIAVSRCVDCGEANVEIPRLAELNRMIAMAIVRKPARLTGPEIRFLRTSLLMNGQNFARLIGVNQATLSRWERGHQVPLSFNDRCVRLMASRETPMPRHQLFDALTGIDAKKRAELDLRFKPHNDAWAPIHA